MTLERTKQIAGVEGGGGIYSSVWPMLALPEHSA